MSLSKDGEQEAVVWVRRSSWERVTLSEELVGRLRAESRLPQYLGEVSKAPRRPLEAEGAGEVGEVLDDSDVHRREGACPVDVLFPRHSLFLPFMGYVKALERRQSWETPPAEPPGPSSIRVSVSVK